ncbi:two-component system, chemotaxis family, sensor kinase CheA [uncultured Gammaproteobacteria bacterium]
MAGAIDPAETFRQEAVDLLAQLEEALLDMERSPDDPGLVDTVFRALHTLKGSGAMFGWDALAAFTHHVETAYDLVRKGEMKVSSDLVRLTLAATDHIRDLLTARENVDQVRGAALLSSFRDLTPGGGRSGHEAGPDGGKSVAGRGKSEPSGPCVFRIRFHPGPEVMAFGTNPLLLLDELRDLGSCEVTPITDRVPPLNELDPVECYLGWDILLTTTAPRSAIEDVFIFVVDQSELTIDRIELGEEDAEPQRLGEILIARGDIAATDIEETLGKQERLGSLLVKSGKVSDDRITSALAEQRHVREASKARETSASASTIRVPAERLDSLMDQVGELVIAQARLMQMAVTNKEPLLTSISEEMERLAASLRDTTMGIRMLPIGTLFGKFRRVVHDLSHELGKAIELSTAGEETELDKTVIECLNDPLVHLIRNAVDHGIEDQGVRVAHDKPAAGRVLLSAVHSGAQVLITIEDDGKGLDSAAIRAKAEEKGLISSGQELSENELFSFIFHPGFSTAAQVTSISGRGVGMDVVKRTIDGLRGTIEVASTVGQGTAITLKLPLTLAIIDGLLVRLGNERYVLPLSAVEECVELSRAEDHRSDGRCFLNIRGDIVAYIRLRELFNLAGEGESIQKVVIVSTGDTRIGLVVDQVIGQHQTVIKSLSRLHRDQEGFSGATILGDGSVALILDIPHLIKLARERETSLRAA